MRLSVLAAALAATTATPAAAQQPPPPPAQIPPELMDPGLIDRLGDVTGVLAKALMNMPVGEIEAAIENRPVTREDRRRTVADAMGADAREIDQDVERGKVAMRQGGQAMVRALPVITRELNRIGDELGRVINNMPSPVYPRR